jgi:hypothetical protein
MKKVIMTGCPRSGTTALCTLLSHDPDTLITNEVGNFSWEQDSFIDRLNKIVNKHYIEWALNLKNIDKEDFVENVKSDVTRFAENISEKYSIKVVGDKLPGYINSLYDIYHANREAYYIITLRSVQHFVTSSINHYNKGVRTGWTFETITEAEKFWVATNCKLIEDIGKIIPFGAKIILIRYEDIGPDIDRTINKISLFLGHEFKISNPRGGFDPPNRRLKQFIPSSQAQFLMDVFGYDL